ncbi:phosphoribosylamine--glycine ligase [Oscillospiraceae bacterium MB08-C2-2]|nr:phosphoribosylamine--glycine ligase [Oscillospiraceae bacterium MB08-C2-2]
MKVLVVGSGGREHAIIHKLAQSNPAPQLFCAPGNGGIGAQAQCVPIKVTDLEAMTAFALEQSIDFVVVAPDDPLALGMVDALEKAGIPAFGPTALAAQIEASKVFSKNLMRKYSIPTADFAVFDQPEQAGDYIRSQNSFPTVIKADGLALGKGVIIAQNLEEALEGIKSIMEDKVFGESGSRVVVEEFITGPEVSVLAFTDGKTVLPMISSMDHKRALDGDKGLNTGGMGVIAPNPHYTPDIAAQCMETIFLPTIRAMAAEGRPFKGCLYFGLMLTPKGSRVIEYNCRFGDPEAQAVLSLLETDLLDILMAVREERLADMEIKWKPGASACVIMASGGYPGRYQTGCAIEGLNTAGQLESQADTTVYHAGTRLENGQYLTAGGRVLGVTATAPSLPAALEKAYAGVECIHFADAHFRRDIGGHSH